MNIEITSLISGYHSTINLLTIEFNPSYFYEIFYNTLTYGKGSIFQTLVWDYTHEADILEDPSKKG